MILQRTAYLFICYILIWDLCKVSEVDLTSGPYTRRMLEVLQQRNYQKCPSFGWVLTHYRIFRLTIVIKYFSTSQAQLKWSMRLVNSAQPFLMNLHKLFESFYYDVGVKYNATFMLYLVLWLVMKEDFFGTNSCQKNKLMNSQISDHFYTRPPSFKSFGPFQKHFKHC